MNYQYYMNPMEYEDLMDEKYFDKLYPKTCKSVKPYVLKYLDDKAMRDPRCFYTYPTKQELDKMIEDIHILITTRIGEESFSDNETRQYGAGIGIKDLIGVLLLGDLLKRRRYYRRFPYYNYYY